MQIGMPVQIVEHGYFVAVPNGVVARFHYAPSSTSFFGLRVNAFPKASNKSFKPFATLTRTLCTPHPLRMPSALLRSEFSAQSAA